MATRCSATTKSGHPCRAWAARAPSPYGPGPSLCSAHGGGKRPVGAPPGNTNALKHGFYSAEPTDVTFDEAIADLVDKITRLDDIIATAKNGEYVIRIFELYTQASSRLSRMLHDRRALF